MEICSKNKVTWQTNPLKLKILNFIGNGKSPETVGKLIEEIKQMVLYHEITFERYQVPLVLKEKKNLQKEFPIIIKNETTKKINLEYRNKLYSGQNYPENGKLKIGRSFTFFFDQEYTSDFNHCK